MKIDRMLIIMLLIVVPFAPGLDGMGQAGEFPTGQIIEKVACLADASQSYALYLPTHYSPEKRWPILYGFDPGGRGKQPVEYFREAAEKYGWIVVGSNNSRNGPGVPLNEIVQALWRDTHERLPIDDRRIYTTGMSGGARVAVSVAIAMKDHIAGVIACAAGFPSVKTPTKDMRFAFLGIAGVEDFNLIELRRLEEPLEKAGITHQLLTFDGDHGWPPKAVLFEAVEWMEVQAMKSDRRAKDDRLITELYTQGLNRAHQFEESARPYDAFIRYRLLADSFNGLRAVDEVSAHAQRLQNSKEVQSAITQLKVADRQQETRAREVFAVLQSSSSSDTAIQSIAEARRLIAPLRKKAEETNPTTERVVARRLLGQFSVAVSEAATGEMYRKNYGQAAGYLTIAAEIRPNNPQVWFRLAAAQAQSGDKKRALESLKRAVEKGFNDATRLEQAPELAPLRQEEEFRSLLKQLKDQPGQHR